MFTNLTAPMTPDSGLIAGKLGEPSGHQCQAHRAEGHIRDGQDQACAGAGQTAIVSSYSMLLD